jgi:hypothetical protein
MAEPPEDLKLLSDEARAEWFNYLNQWEEEVYAPLFKPRGISRDAALTCWFVNRLRNAIPDDDAGNDVNEPWRG